MNVASVLVTLFNVFVWLVIAGRLLVFAIEVRRGEDSFRDANGRLRPLPAVMVIAGVIALLALVARIAT